MAGVIWSDLLFPKLSVRHSSEPASAYMYIFLVWVGHSCKHCYVISKCDMTKALTIILR